MTVPPSAARKLALDEEFFQQLLAAAYALQENKNVLQAANSEQDSAAVFAEIAPLKSKVFPPHDPASGYKNPVRAATLVAECLQRLTNADGASVCLIMNGYLKCAAFAGSAVKVPGGSVASNSLVATERLRNGSAFLSANACSDIRLDPAQCVKLKIGSLLAVPITVNSDVAGLIELRWSKPEAFRDGDERICQLLVELMSEVLGSDASQAASQVTPPVQVTPPRKAITAIVTPVARAEEDQELTSLAGNEREPAATSEPVCRVCGKPLNDDLNFCGNCGMLSPPTDNGMQGKWASMWFMQQAQQAAQPKPDRRERLWPIERADVAARSTETLAPEADRQQSEESDTARAEVSAAGRRGPRRVLSVLKAQLRARNGERKPPPS